MSSSAVDTNLRARFQVEYEYSIHFTRALFDVTNPLLARIAGEMKILIVLDQGVSAAHPALEERISTYAKHHGLDARGEVLPVPGGEQCKNDPALLQTILERIHDEGLDRHSAVLAVGGGALLDLAGFAAATAHRGVRLIRVPTTVLAQNDSGVGVKNGVNAFDKKNFLGTFAPPFAVLNDADFLTTLDARDWRAGMAEAVKVSLLKDAVFFEWIENNAALLADRNMEAMEYLIRRCAELHLNHITKGGDSFETGSSRPLDFGHWAAHKLEQLTNYALRHGEAVAMGMALDVSYAAQMDMLPEVLRALGFRLFHGKMESSPGDASSPRALFAGLEEFREHLGGRLTVTLLTDVGRPLDVHEIDLNVYRRVVDELKREFGGNE